MLSASLAALAAETGATAATVEQAAHVQDLVIIAVPGKAVPQLPCNMLATTSAVVVDIGNYYPSRDGRIAEIDGGLTDSEWVAQVLGRPIVKASNTIVAISLAMRGVPVGTTGRICLSIAGDEVPGFDGIDTDTLADSWRQHSGTPAYCENLDADGFKPRWRRLMPSTSLAACSSRRACACLLCRICDGRHSRLAHAFLSLTDLSSTRNAGALVAVSLTLPQYAALTRHGFLASASGDSTNERSTNRHGHN